MEVIISDIEFSINPLSMKISLRFKILQLMKFFFHVFVFQDDSAKYDKFFQHSGSLFAETAASKARTECARYVYL